MGHARTFWTAFERARDAGGTLVMRMEDLDPDRSRAEYAEAALEDLHWLGIRWQEGPDIGGPFAPYAQSSRRAIYLDAWRKLLRGGFLFPCRCSRKDLEAALSAPHESDPSNHRRAGAARRRAHLSRHVPAAAEQHSAAARFRRERDRRAGQLQLALPRSRRRSNRVCGQESRPAALYGRPWTLATLSSGGATACPSYQLACVADDAAMKITEVVRGEDLLKSTARQILLYRALWLETPGWFHCRLVVDATAAAWPSATTR